MSDGFPNVILWAITGPAYFQQKMTALSFMIDDLFDIPLFVCHMLRVSENGTGRIQRTWGDSRFEVGYIDHRVNT